MKKRLEAAKATYDTYEKWYDKYARNVQMRTSKFSEKEFFRLYRDAKAQQALISDPKDRKNFMRNFSQVVARKQRQASELQLRVTWTAVKEVSGQIGENIKRTEEAYVKDIIRKDLVKGRRNLTSAQIRSIEEEVQRRFDAGVPEEITAKAKKLTAQKLSKEINLLETYKGLDWKRFKKEQKEILQRYHALFGKEHRSIWDEAFAIYYEKGLNYKAKRA